MFYDVDEQIVAFIRYDIAMYFPRKVYSNLQVIRVEIIVLHYACTQNRCFFTEAQKITTSTIPDTPNGPFRLLKIRR